MQEASLYQLYSSPILISGNSLPSASFPSAYFHSASASLKVFNCPKTLLQHPDLQPHCLSNGYSQSASLLAHSRITSLKKHRLTDSAPHFMQLAAILQALQLCVPDFHLVCRSSLLSFYTYPKKLVLLYYSALLYTRKNITVLTPENTKKEIAPKQRKILYPHEKKSPLSD